jgi:hypothetical protein
VIFSTGFDEGYEANGPLVQGGVELHDVSDPAGSGRGSVVRGVIIGDPANQGSYWAYRGYVGAAVALAGEVRLEEDIYVDAQLLKDATSGWRWLVHQNLFDDSSTWHVAIRTTIRGSTNGYMLLVFKDREKEIFTQPVPGAPRFTADRWHSMATEVRREQDSRGQTIWRAYLFQDGRLVTSGELPKSLKRDGKGQPTWEGYHGGPIYAGAGGSDLSRARFSKGGLALIDNMTILTK